MVHPSRGGWEWRRVKRNVDVSSPQREADDDEQGAASDRAHLEVQLCDWSLPARVRVLVVDPLAVTFHLGQVLVEDLARPQR